MKQSYYSKSLAVVSIAAALGSFSSILPAQAENQSSEMQDLVRQSQGIAPKAAETRRPQGGHDPAAIYVQAGVDTAQVDKIRELFKNMEKANQTRQAEGLALFKEMHTLTSQAELDETKILATQEKINALQSAVSMEKTKTLISIRKILTPKQREELVAIIRKRSSTQQESAH